MARRVQIETLRQHQDARGSVCEPLRPEELPEMRNVHAVWSEPGAIRGNHYHVRGTEVLTVFGPAMVRIQEESDRYDTDVPAGVAIRFTFPPGIPHAILNTGKTAGLTIAFNSEAHDPARPDVVREVLIDP